MSQPLRETSQWMYRGIWSWLVKWFRVPAEPPTLPIANHANLRSFRPAIGFLRYLKFTLWITLGVITIGHLLVGIAISIAAPLAGLAIMLDEVFLIIPLVAVWYLAIYLRYDTTWYVLSDKSLRTRRGIWVIHETTITFENVQNVSVRQGPLQRFFGIADVVVETAGGGGGAKQGQPGASGAHVGLFEGVDNAPEIRDLIMAKLRKSVSTGLGDDRHPEIASPIAWARDHVQVLREIKDLLKRPQNNVPS